MSSKRAIGCRPNEPCHIVVMGVSGVGKSAVAERLSRALGFALGEGDAHHSPTNIGKLSDGIPLTDADREPWLDALAEWLSAEHALGRSTVLSCSALKRRYRDRLRAAVPNVRFVHLTAGEGVLIERMNRRAHFMPPRLLAAQLHDLEPLQPDEPGIVVDATRALDDIAAELAARFAPADT